MEGRHLQEESMQCHTNSPSPPPCPSQDGTQSRDQTTESQLKEDEEGGGKTKQMAPKAEASDTASYE